MAEHRREHLLVVYASLERGALDLELAVPSRFTLYTEMSLCTLRPGGSSSTVIVSQDLLRLWLSSSLPSDSI